MGNGYRFVLFTGSRHFLRDPAGARVVQNEIRRVVREEAHAKLVQFVMGDAPGVDPWSKYFGHREGVQNYIFTLNGRYRLYSTESLYLDVGSWDHGMSTIDERPRPIQRDEAMVKWTYAKANGSGKCYAFEHLGAPTSGTRTTVEFWKKQPEMLPFEHYVWDGASLCLSPP